jgi:hypothetical protein
MPRLVRAKSLEAFCLFLIYSVGVVSFAKMSLKNTSIPVRGTRVGIRAHFTFVVWSLAAKAFCYAVNSVSNVRRGSARSLCRATQLLVTASLLLLDRLTTLNRTNQSCHSIRHPPTKFHYPGPSTPHRSTASMSTRTLL